LLIPWQISMHAAPPITRGTCPVCGSKVVRIGGTEAHKGLTPPDDIKRGRHGKLVIVESPAKAKTVGRFLGKGYTVRASVGHVRDLRKNQLSIDVEHDFKPRYQVPVEKKELVSQITDLAALSKKVFLATDPDREGEAIAWHLMEAANIDPARTERVVFMKLPVMLWRKLSPIHARSTWTWSMPNRHAACWIGWWGTT